MSAATAYRRLHANLIGWSWKINASDWSTLSQKKSKICRKVVVDRKCIDAYPVGLYASYTVSYSFVTNRSFLLHFDPANTAAYVKTEFSFYCFLTDAHQTFSCRRHNFMSQNYSFPSPKCLGNYNGTARLYYIQINQHFNKTLQISAFMPKVWMMSLFLHYLATCVLQAHRIASVLLCCHLPSYTQILMVCSHYVYLPAKTIAVVIELLSTGDFLEFQEDSYSKGKRGLSALFSAGVV